MKPSASTIGGAGLRLVFRAAKVLRPLRPIHPGGISLTGLLERLPVPAPGSGISWLDTPGTVTVQARLSRSVGLPPALPDILGLALRIPAGSAYCDLLLASTGLSRPGRFLLVPRKSVSAAALTTLMPYKGGRGPVQLAARTLAPVTGLPAAPDAFRRALAGRTWTLALYHAGPWGKWRRFGTLSLGLDPARADTGVRFDPVLHPLPGAEIYEWTRRLREPSYAVARLPLRPGIGRNEVAENYPK
ncbi:hypothetical protein ACFQ36_08865 [Arthrobacter sp. GCM10027362]|uniref:hypothetical protein n=1 Tax=Arthrobacter sp. GCM10027362 TaxID=3273379 RepID=UPI00363AB647